MKGLLPFEAAVHSLAVRAKNDQQALAVPLVVERGTNKEAPQEWLVAIVNFYVAAESHEIALRKALVVLENQGFVLKDLLDGAVLQLDPEKWWDGHVMASYPGYSEHFPTQEQMLEIMKEGLVFHGPFAGWDREQTVD